MQGFVACFCLYASLQSEHSLRVWESPVAMSSVGFVLFSLFYVCCTPSSRDNYVEPVCGALVIRLVQISGLLLVFQQ